MTDFVEFAKKYKDKRYYKTIKDYAKRIEALQDKVARYHEKMSLNQVLGRIGNIKGSLTMAAGKGEPGATEEYDTISEMLQEAAVELEEEFYATFSQSM